MIDDKKIEDAAKSLRKDFNDDVTQGFLVEFGFEKGAKWAINEFLKDLWRPVSEKPRRNTICLVQIRDCIFETFYDSAEWEIFVKDLNITRWLYIDDLFPKKITDETGNSF